MSLEEDFSNGSIGKKILEKLSEVSEKLSETPKEKTKIPSPYKTPAKSKWGDEDGGDSLSVLNPKQIDAMITKLSDLKEKKADPKVKELTVKVEELTEENKKLSEKLSKFESKEKESRISSVIEKELKVGMLSEQDVESRKKELSEMDLSKLEGTEAYVNKVFEKLSEDEGEAEEEPEKPEKPEAKDDEEDEPEDLAEGNVSTQKLSRKQIVSADEAMANFMMSKAKQGEFK